MYNPLLYSSPIACLIYSLSTVILLLYCLPIVRSFYYNLFEKPFFLKKEKHIDVLITPICLPYLLFYIINELYHIWFCGRGSFFVFFLFSRLSIFLNAVTVRRNSRKRNRIWEEDRRKAGFGRICWEEMLTNSKFAKFPPNSWSHSDWLTNSGPQFRPATLSSITHVSGSERNYRVIWHIKP